MSEHDNFATFWRMFLHTTVKTCPFDCR